MNKSNLFLSMFIGGFVMGLLGALLVVEPLFIIIGPIISISSIGILFLPFKDKTEQYEEYTKLPDLRQAHKSEIQKKELGFVVNPIYELERHVNEAQELANTHPLPSTGHWEDMQISYDNGKHWEGI